MAVRRRGSRWVADYRDSFHVRRVKAFKTKEAARDYEVKELAARSGQLRPDIDPDISFAAYAKRYVANLEARGASPKTVIRVRGALDNHIIPSRIGSRRVRDVSRPDVKTFLLGRMSDDAGSAQGRKIGKEKRTRKRLARGTVHHLYRVISAVLGAAVEDQLITAHPVRGMWAAVFGRAKKGRTLIKALDAAQLRKLLETVRRETPEHYPAIATMAWAGLRVGEALALIPDDIDAQSKRILIRDPKDDEERFVDAAPVLLELLRPARQSARVVTMDGNPMGEAPSGPWLFYPETMGPAAPATKDDAGPKPEPKAEARAYKALARAFARALKSAGLPNHFTLHSLRHSYATSLISAGVPIQYVQQQMGHASPEMTVKTYGSWLPASAPGAVEALVARTAPGAP